MEKLHRQITGTQRINQKVKLYHAVTVTSTQALITGLTSREPQNLDKNIYIYILQEA